MTKKKKVQQEPLQIIFYKKEFDCYGGFEKMSFEEVSKKLITFKEEVLKNFPNEPSEIFFHIETVPCGYNGGFDIHFVSSRKETKQEVDNRIKNARLDEIEKEIKKKDKALEKLSGLKNEINNLKFEQSKVLSELN